MISNSDALTISGTSAVSVSNSNASSESLLAVRESHEGPSSLSASFFFLFVARIPAILTTMFSFRTLKPSMERLEKWYTKP